MVEHSLCMRGARGSIPRISIIIMKIFPSLLFFIFLCVSPFYKKRQRQGSNLRSQREIAQQATALTTRPRCPYISYSLIQYTIYHIYSILYIICHMEDMIFLKKRQWQDLNLRIQRIIDFKSIALDHSATLSSPLCTHSPLLFLQLSVYMDIYIEILICIYVYISISIYVYGCVLLSYVTFFSLSVDCVFSFFSVRLSLVCRFSFFSEIFNSIVGQYLRLSRERPGFESPLKSFLFFF